MDQPTIITLLQKHFSGSIDAAEKEQLLLWLKNVDAQAFNTVIDSAKNVFPAEYTRVNDVNDVFAERLEANVNALEQEESDLPSTVHRIHFLRTAWFRYAAAIILIFGIGAYIYTTQQKEKPSVTQTNPVPLENDVAPGGNRATLTLADGSKIILDSAKSGELAKEENATISKTADGKIVYDPNEHLADRILFNTMTTPRGGQYQLTLPDGSQVWLNAESSITYPTAFTGNERRVTITGEAYFEVAKNKTKPFKVDIGNATIEVLGTHFNVNTYKDELTNNTTLLEGSVRIKTVHTSLTLKPGQQGQLTKDQQLSLAVNPDINQVMAWKNGNFYFDNKSLRSILDEFSRWYDVDVVYESQLKNRTFFGIVKRDRSLSHVLKLLQDNNIKFRIEGKKLIVQSD